MRTLATLRRPRSVQVLPNGKLLVSDEDTLVVLSAKDGKRGKQPKLLPFSAPEGIAISATAVYVTDSHQHQLHRLHLDDLTPNGAVGSPGSGPDQLTTPSGVACADDLVFVSDCNNHRIVCYDTRLLTPVGDPIGREGSKEVRLPPYQMRGRDAESRAPLLHTRRASCAILTACLSRDEHPGRSFWYATLTIIGFRRFRSAASSYAWSGPTPPSTNRWESPPPNSSGSSSSQSASACKSSTPTAACCKCSCCPPTPHRLPRASSAASASTRQRGAPTWWTGRPGASSSATSPPASLQHLPTHPVLLSARAAV